MIEANLLAKLAMIALMVLLMVSDSFAASIVKQSNKSKKDETVVPIPPTIIQNNPYEWPKKSQYYFTSLENHVKSFLPESCVNSLTISSYNAKEIDFPLTDSRLQIATVPICQNISKWWKSIPSPTQMRVDRKLCDSVYSSDSPLFSNKGCAASHVMNQLSPRCQTKYLEWVCKNAQLNVTEYSTSSIHDTKEKESKSFFGFSKKPVSVRQLVSSKKFILPESNHTSYSPPTPWLITLKNSLVSKCGTVMTKCGIVHTSTNCLSHGNIGKVEEFSKACHLASNPFKVAAENGQNLSLCTSQSPYGDSVAYVPEIFVAAQSYDIHLGHFVLEVLPRIVYHINFLKKNPEVKILVGCDLSEKTIRHYRNSLKPYMAAIGLPLERLEIHKNVYATKVYLPMESSCQDPVYNAWSLIYMRMFLLRMAAQKPNYPILDYKTINSIASKKGVTVKSTKNSKAKVVKGRIVLIQRSNRKIRRVFRSESDNVWTDKYTVTLQSILLKKIGHLYNVDIFDERNASLSMCYLCQVKAFYETDVLIGMHGSELAYSLYMKPNSAVVEIVPNSNDGRMLLGGGQYSRLAAVLGHNYMTHYITSEERSIKGNEAMSIVRFATHLESFFKDIKFL